MIKFNGKWLNFDFFDQLIDFFDLIINFFNLLIENWLNSIKIGQFCKIATLSLVKLSERNKRLENIPSVFYSEKPTLAGLAKWWEEVGILAHTNTKGEIGTGKRTKLGWFMTRGKQESKGTSQA